MIYVMGSEHEPYAFADEDDGMFVSFNIEERYIPGFSYAELVQWCKQNEFMGVINCETDNDLIKAAAFEVLEGVKHRIYNDGRFWQVQYIGSHEQEDGAYELTAELLATRGRDVVVVPDHPQTPQNWVYYISVGSLNP